MYTSVHNKDIKVLVVDDDAGCRDLLTTILSLDNFNTTSAKDAETAVKLLHSTAFDIVVTDIMLPGMSGIDLLKHIRTHYAELPVILITGYSSIDSAVNALQQGAQDYMVKPLGNCVALMTAIRNAVEHHRLLLQKQEMEAKITEAVEKERQTLGRELHDLLCQDLASISMLSSVLSDNPDAKLINNLAKKSVSFVKGLCSGLFPVELEEEGLVSSINQLIQNQQTMTHIPCSVEVSGNINMQDSTKALHIYRITQESLNNAIKHSGAHNIDIKLTGESERGRLTIEDDGKGINNSDESSTGMGLHIMKYRANMIGADLCIEPGDNCGTKVTCSW